MSTAAPIARLVTEEERDAYQTNGWVFLKRLIEPDVAREILQRVQDRIAAAGDDVRPSSSLEAKRLFRTYVDPAADDDLIGKLGHSDELGSVAAHLTGRSVRRWNNEILIKMPISQGGSVTPWHQDLPYLPHDRVGRPNIWIALSDVDAERSPLRFLSGTHRCPPLGRFVHAPEHDAVATWPHLTDEFPISPPLEFEPGDATVHESPVVHSARANTSEEPRWVYVNTYVTTDVLYTGLPNRLTDGLGLSLDEPFEHENFPLIGDLPTSW
jgi:hypothetical protein